MTAFVFSLLGLLIRALALWVAVAWTFPEIDLEFGESVVVAALVQILTVYPSGD